MYTYVGITRSEAMQRVMAAKLTRLTNKIAIQLRLMAESYSICSSRSWRTVQKLLGTLSYKFIEPFFTTEYEGKSKSKGTLKKKANLF
jgi:hypothetical protein